MAWPVLRGDGASLKAIRYVGSIGPWLRSKLDADPSYSNSTVKNPPCQQRRVETRQETHSDPDWLADDVNLVLTKTESDVSRLASGATARCSRT
jgi:hypothetical protein